MLELQRNKPEEETFTMIRTSLLLGLVLAATALPIDSDVKLQVDRLGKSEVTYFNLKGLLIPDVDDGASTRTLVFRTEGEEGMEEEMLTFTCMPLNNVYVSDKETRKDVILCQAEAPVTGVLESPNLVFLFASEGLKISPEEKKINLLLGKSTVANLGSVSDTLLGTTVVGDRVKRHFRGFSGSGARAGASSVSGGGFLGGLGGGFSVSEAHASAGSNAGGYGFGR